MPVKDINGLTILAKDEHMRPQTDMQSLGQLKAAFVQMGEMGGFDAVAIAAHPDVEFVNHVHHAGNSSGIVDGAAAVLVGSKEGGAKAGLKPRAASRASPPSAPISRSCSPAPSTCRSWLCARPA